MLKYTGHPLVDVGVATITAYAKKREPSLVTATDLEQFAKFMEEIYFGGRWRGLMFTIFPNSAYTQPKLSKEKKDAYRETFIYGFRTSSPKAEERCAFCGEAMLTRGFRQNVPLLTGEGTVNFFPWGNVGLPVCGVCALAVQAFLLGSVKCAGRALFVHADDESMTLEFARRFLIENQRFLSLKTVSKEEEGAQNIKYPRTYFVARLLEVETERRQAEEDETPCSITIYHLTNYGTNPDIALYHFPYHLVSFLRQAHRAPHGETWRQIERRAWELAIEKAKGKKQDKENLVEKPAGPQPRDEPGRARNYLYEDLFDLPHNAARFVRTYFLRRAYRFAREEDPRHAYSLQRELQLVSWTLAAIFLKEVMNVNQHRIETIKRIADRIAEHIMAENDRKLFRGLWMSRGPSQLRRVLVMEDTRLVQSGKTPLFTLDDFIELFELHEDSRRPDWDLTRDLILIRVIEQLYRREWFKVHADVIGQEEMTEATEAAAE
ncbi:MAG: type I-B CRISPR-associated protein Cas8b1/Cst1 [Bacillota bacterium]